MAPASRIFSSDSDKVRKIFLVFTAFANLSIAMGVLYGWISDSVTLKSIFPTLTPMNPMSAVCFATVALCFICFAFYPHNQKIIKIAATMTAILLLIIGGSMLIYYVFGVDVRIDRILFTSKLGVNRMASTTASCFTLLSIALLFYVYARPKVMKIAIRTLTLISALVALYALVGYAYGIQPVYGVALLNPMALHTAALFLLTSAALFIITVSRFVVYVSLPLLTAYFIGAVVFIVLSVLSLRSFTNFNKVNSQIQGLYTQQTNIEGLRIALLDAETGQRGYLLTGNLEYLDPYSLSTQRVTKALSKLASETPNIISNPRFAYLQQLTDDKMDELAQTINEKKAGNSLGALELVESGRGKADLDAIWKILDLTDTQLNTNLNALLTKSHMQSQNLLLSLSILTVSILCLLLVSLYLLQENLKRQRIHTQTVELEQNATTVKNRDLENEASNRVEELEKVKQSLEDEVQKRTDELKFELEKSQQQNSFMVNRELRMVELKEELSALRSKTKK